MSSEIAIDSDKQAKHAVEAPILKIKTAPNHLIGNILVQDADDPVAPNPNPGQPEVSLVEGKMIDRPALETGLSPRSFRRRSDNKKRSGRQVRLRAAPGQWFSARPGCVGI